MTIGERIKERRLQLGLSADDVAAKLNKNRATVYRYESSFIESMPTTVLEPLANALQTTPAYLMGWDDAAEPENKKNDAITDIILRLRADDELLALITKICNLTPEQLSAVRAVLSVL